MANPAQPTNTSVMDSEASSSERGRRLIPFMTFYLPSSQIPINQQYSKQMQPSNASDQQAPQENAIESAGPLPPPGYIAIPTTFLQVQTSPNGPTAITPAYGSQSSHQPRYRPIPINNQYPVQINLKTTVGTPQPLLHLLPSGQPGRASSGNYAASSFRDARPNKSKSNVQHFPPLPQRNEPKEQPAVYRQRLQPSKVNLTPFTSSNTVPGHFVPIIYSPTSDDGDNDKSNIPNEEAINYNYNDTPDELPPPQFPQGQQKFSSDTYREQHPQQIIVEPIQLPPSSKETILLQQQKQQPTTQQEPLIKFIAIAGVTGPSLENTPSTQSGPIYQIINDHSPSTPRPYTHQTPNSLQPYFHPQYRPSKHPHFYPSKSESFYNDDEQQQQRQHENKQPQQQQYVDSNDLTPQEKYVLYLQQQRRYNNKQQYQQQKQQQYPTQPTTSKDRKHYLLQTPTPGDVFIYSTTASPIGPDPNISYQGIRHNYPQHSPVRHNVYLRPELSVPPNHKPTTQTLKKPIQQVLHIPVRTLLSEIDTLQNDHSSKGFHHQQQQKQQQQYHVNKPPQFSNAPGYPNFQYADNVVEEPQQFLEESYHQNVQSQKSESPPLASPTPPPAAFIVITTAAPPHLLATPTKPHEYKLSTQRPIYKNSPTLRLQPITAQVNKYAHATKRPATPASIEKATTKAFHHVKYYSSTPTYNQLIPSPTPAIQLKPSMKYQAGARIPTPTPNYIGNPINHQYENSQHNQPQNQPNLEDPNQLPDIRTSSLAEILHKLQASNHLPQTLTPDNIDNSIKTLITILNNLKRTQTIVPNPPQHHEPPPRTPDYDYSDSGEREQNNNKATDFNLITPPIGPNKHPGPSTGRPGIDYPNYAEIPRTSFDCAQQRYKGFFGDPETNCQAWHYCDLNGGKASFLCPNGTIFSQIALTCDWWFNVKCSTTAQLYVLNERLYKYILPFSPKFPEDYSGPIVDKYLAMKFQEMEEKMRLEKEKAGVKTEQTDNHLDDATTTSKVDEQSSERNLLTDEIGEDISQRGSIDTYESTTQQTTSPPIDAVTVEEIAPLSVKPIVVSSSTIEPDHSMEYGGATKSEDSQNNTVDDEIEKNSDHYNFERSPHSMREDMKKVTEKSQVQRQSTKISVEKVEVIEIKPDGTSGHITPDMFFRSMTN